MFFFSTAHHASSETVDDMVLGGNKGTAGKRGKRSLPNRPGALAPTQAPLDYTASLPASSMSHSLRQARGRQEPSAQDTEGGNIPDSGDPPLSPPPTYNESVSDSKPLPPDAMPTFSPSTPRSSEQAASGGDWDPAAQVSANEAVEAQAASHTAPDSQQSTRSRRRVRAPVLDIPEKVNWLIHLAYVRKDYVECETLIDSQLKETGGNCEYALYVKGLVLRHRGEMDEALQFFQKAMHLNPHHKDNAKQVARSLFLMSRHRAAIAVYEQILAASILWLYPWLYGLYA